MKIDTLILGGGSTKAPAYIGICRALYELNIINKELQGIKHIITCSVGMVSTIYLLLDISLQVQEKAALLSDFSSLINIDEVDINSLLSCNGLLSNEKVIYLLKGILQHKYNKDDKLNFHHSPLKNYIKLYLNDLYILKIMPPHCFLLVQQ